MWARQGFHSVSMSGDPELRLIELENMTGDIERRAMLVGFATDDHDLPNNEEIKAYALECAPRLGKFLGKILPLKW